MHIYNDKDKDKHIYKDKDMHKQKDKYKDKHIYKDKEKDLSFATIPSSPPVVILFSASLVCVAAFLSST